MGYVEDRLKQYDHSATGARIMYHLTNGYAILGAAAIPVLAQSRANDLTLIAALGASVAAAQGLGTLLRLHENWINYRTAAELIRREKYLFEASAGDYADAAGAAARLVTKVEAIAMTEHRAWLTAVSERQTEAPSASATPRA